VFTEDVAKGIEKDKNWAGELEVSFMIQLLESIHIIVKTYNSDIVRNYDLNDINGYPILHLLNQGENHWVYYSFPEDPVNRGNNGQVDPVARGNNNNGYIPPVARNQGGGRRKTRSSKKLKRKTGTINGHSLIG
jgi:hypothetical protein